MELRAGPSESQNERDQEVDEESGAVSREHREPRKRSDIRLPLTEA